MSDPYLGEIRMFGGNFAPEGWALCQGQLLPIVQNTELFDLLGTAYGGDGAGTFGLPDLRGRAPVHMGQGPGITGPYTLGQLGGAEQVTLTSQQLPVHNHTVNVSTDLANSPQATNQVYAQSTQVKVYTQDIASKFFAPGTVSIAGAGSPHDNMQPFLVVEFIIALEGVFPTQN